MIRHWSRYHDVDEHYVIGHWIEREAPAPLDPASYLVGDPPVRYRWTLGPAEAAEAVAFAEAFEGLHRSDGIVMPIWVHKKPAAVGDVELCEWEQGAEVESRPDIPGRYDLKGIFSERPRTRPEDGEA